jgi:hypothetical protein
VIDRVWLCVLESDCVPLCVLDCVCDGDLLCVSVREVVCVGVCVLLGVLVRVLVLEPEGVTLCDSDCD